MNVKIDFDKDADVLYVRMIDLTISHSQESDLDSNIIINYNLNNSIVGVQILGISRMLDTPPYWFEHPDRTTLPKPIMEEIDAWITKYQFRDQNEIATKIYGKEGVIYKLLRLGGLRKDHKSEDLAMKAAKRIWDNLEVLMLGFDDIEDERKQKILEGWKDIILEHMS